MRNHCRCANADVSVVDGLAALHRLAAGTFCSLHFSRRRNAASLQHRRWARPLLSKPRQILHQSHSHSLCHHTHHGCHRHTAHGLWSQDLGGESQIQILPNRSACDDRVTPLVADRTRALPVVLCFRALARKSKCVGVRMGLWSRWVILAWIAALIF